MLRKYTDAWKVEELKKKGKIAVQARNRFVKFRFKGSDIFITIGGKDLTIDGATVEAKTLQQVLDAISVSSIDGSKVMKSHGTDNVFIGFSEYLTQGTTYTVSMEDPGLDGIIVTPFPAKTITTMETVTLTFATDERSYFNKAEDLYRLDPSFTLTSTYGFNSSDKAVISSCLLVSDLVESDMTKAWSGSSLALYFNDELEVGKAYTISIADLSDIEAIEIEVFSPKVFNTVENNSYIVYHYKQNIYDDNFTLVSADTENLIARVNSTLTPPVKTYTGFTSPDTQNLFISYQNPNVVEYRYTRNSYTVTVQNTTGFNGTPTGGGSYKYQADVTVNCVLLAGYSFEGWTSPDYSGWTNSSYSASFSMPAQDVTMKANAKIIPYSISYTLNGGTVATANPTGYDVTSATITLNNPTRTGYTFAGWTGSNGTSPQTTVTIPTGSINNKSYTANWNVITYNISYTLNGGSVATANPSTYNVETNSFTLTNPTRNGYTFTGWSGTGLSGTTNKSVTVTKGSTGARSYTANWSVITYTISYTLNGGAVSTANPTSYTVESNAITLNNPSKSYYNFSGWGGTSLSGTANTSVTIPKGSTGNRSYTAYYTPISYSITYNLNGGSIASSNLISNYTYESPSFTIPRPGRAGYTFAGWSGIGMDATIPNHSSGNKSYTATWNSSGSNYVAASNYNDSRFNVQGIVNGTTIDCTYGSGGFYTYVLVDGNQTQMTSYSQTIDSKVTITREYYIDYDGLGTLKYTITNITGSNVTVGVSFRCDTKVNGDDAVQIYTNTYGMYMSNGYTFQIYAQNYSGVDTMTGYWGGQLGSVNSYLWTTGKYTESSGDSGLTANWQNKVIGAYGTINLKCKFGFW